MHEHGMVSTNIATLVWLPYLGSISAHCRREQHIQTITEWACTPHPSQRIPSREVQVTAGDTTVYQYLVKLQNSKCEQLR